LARRFSRSTTVSGGGGAAAGAEEEEEEGEGSIVTVTDPDEDDDGGGPREAMAICDFSSSLFFLLSLCLKFSPLVPFPLEIGRTQFGRILQGSSRFSQTHECWTGPDRTAGLNEKTKTMASGGFLSALDLLRQ
jgi:hypothetical protein